MSGEAFYLIVAHLLLMQEDITGTVSAADKAVMKKTNDKISFPQNVPFTQRKSLRTTVRRILKTKSMQYQVTSPLVNCRNLLGDHDNLSARVEKKGLEERTVRGYPVSYLHRYLDSNKLAVS